MAMLAPVEVELQRFSDDNLRTIYAEFPGKFDRPIMSTPQVIHVLRFVRQFKGSIVLREPKNFGKILGIYDFHGLGPVPRPVVLSKRAQRKKDREDAARKASENVIK